MKAEIAGVVEAGTPIDLVAQGFDGTEGPLPLPDGSLIFTENRVDRIRRIADDGAVSVFLERGRNPNSLARAPDGTHHRRADRGPGIAVVSPADKARVLVDSYNGKPLNRPNDLIVDRSGGIYFTDPVRVPRQRQPGVAAAWRAAYSQRCTTWPPRASCGRSATDIKRPNGVSAES